MAIKTWNGTNFDDHLGATGLGSSSVSVTTTGTTSTGFTAPNLTNKATGVWLAVTTVPTSGNFIVELMESGVSKASATINRADMVLGWNYVRFATPYQFATLTASAYTVRVKNSSTNSGTLRQATSTLLLYQVTYDTATTLGTTDDMWLGGFNDAGLTTKTYTATGTSMVFGSGADTSLPTTWATGWGLMIGSGGSFVYDTTASTTVQIKGSVGVYTGGLFDMRGNASDISIVSTLIFDNVADGNFGLIVVGSGLGGQILATGKTVSVINTYVSGTGTSGSPVNTGTAHNFAVNDEIVFGGANDYLKNEVRYVKSIPSSTQLVLSSTIGGAESALAQTHANGSYIANMTRNSVIKNTNTAFGFSIIQVGTVQSPASNFSYMRAEYPNCLSGRAIQFGSSTTTVNTTFDGFVVYGNSANGRSSINFAGLGAQTVSNIVLYNTRGTNYSAQSGLALTGASNKTINGLYHFAEPSSTTCCAMLSISSTSTNNIVNNAHSYGANAGNAAAGYAIGIFGSGNTLNNCSVNACRRNGIYFSQAVLNTINNSTFGTIATNSVDIFLETTTLIQSYFNTCSFSSATLISQYLLSLEGSIVKFQNMDGNTSKHRWYTNHGSFWSSGSGLTDTTVRTASSLALAGKPEDASAGSSWVFKIPANPTSQVGIFGYAYRNATFSSGTLKVELFLPGTLLTGTPDATYTFPTTTGSWLPFNISAYYSSSDTRYAQVKITGVTATAGAYFFIDDLYDAGTGNKVAGLDLWDEGQPSQIMVQSDFSVVPSAVWGFSDANTNPNTMGQQLVDVPSSTQNASAVQSELNDDFSSLTTDIAELTAAQTLPNLLILDKLSD